MRDSHIELFGTAAATSYDPSGGTYGIEIEAGGSGTGFRDTTTVDAPFYVNNIGAVQMVSDTSVLSVISNLQLQHAGASPGTQTDHTTL